MKKLLAAIVLLLTLATIAWAEIDYNCVRMCVNSGQPYGACVQACKR